MSYPKITMWCERCNQPGKETKDGEWFCHRCGVWIETKAPDTPKWTSTTVPLQRPKPPMIVIEGATDNESDDELRKRIQRALQVDIDRIFELPISWDVQMLEPGRPNK